LKKKEKPTVRKKENLPKKISEMKEQKLNWVTILLSFLALILGGGLIPFWIYVILTLNK
jgi:hypothetical protein